jgi:hypothetical protein
MRTLEIEPENLSAHHNLALVYTALDYTEQAQRHRALHEKYRPDDNAVEQAATLHRSRNPAADKAAAAIAIYVLNKQDRKTQQP